MATLIQTVMDALTPDILAKLASLSGESSASAGKGIGAAVAALFAGAARQSSTPGGAGALLGLVTQATANGNPLDNVGSQIGDDALRATALGQGQSLASSLLGGNTGGVSDAVAAHAGVKPSSAASMLALAAPLVLGALGRAAGPDPTSAGLQSLLASERTGILAALPAGLSSLLGFGGGTAAAVSAAAPSGGGLMRYLPWLLAALAALLLLVFGMRGCNTKVEAPEIAAPAAPAVPSLPVIETPSLPQVTLTLPGGGALSVAEGSIGYGVTRFLESKEPAPKTFVFDNLNFDTASNQLTPESQSTVDALTAILKAYPSVVARIAGYTDNRGDPAANRALSDRRAATVAQAIIAGGVDAGRLTAAGMGEASPIADNATENGRAKNRRTELTIVKK
jgi:outer membrane protein OmpA-like peptidoglycan-associated protein